MYNREYLIGAIAKSMEGAYCASYFGIREGQCDESDCVECFTKCLDKILKPSNENYILDQLQQMVDQMKSEVKQ